MAKIRQKVEKTCPKGPFSWELPISCSSEPQKKPLFARIERPSKSPTHLPQGPWSTTY